MSGQTTGEGYHYENDQRIYLGTLGRTKGTFCQEARISMSVDTVLVVEDSRAMQRTLQRLFESDSLQVQIASDGPTGLELSANNFPARWSLI